MKSRKLSESITFKVLIALSLTVILSMLIFGVYSYVVEMKADKSDLNAQAEQAIARLSVNLVAPLWNFEDLQIETLARLELTNKNIMAVLVRDDSKSLYFGLTKPNLKTMKLKKVTSANINDFNLKDSFIIKKQSIFRVKNLIGSVEIYASDYFMQQKLFWLLVRIVAQILTLTLLISTVVFIAIKKLALDKLVYLDQVIARFTQRDWSVRADESSKDELGHLGRSLNEMADTIQEYSEHMEDLVNTRTKEVRSLLEQQHGDYYLTTLLVTPLIQNIVKSKTVTTKFYLEQKKKFKFRRWDAQIGGDVCISNTISLNGRSYTVFANADAMGKSLQGAGGAIIYGVVLNNFINATLDNPSYRYGYSPQKWLQTIFENLQKIFVVFKGYMLISSIIGLVDDLTGQTFYFNSEHPWLIRYRKGKAEFVQDETSILHKIGVDSMGSDFTYNEISLHAGDVLFLGSDGKDDLNLTPDDNEREINEDETLFLRFIEQGEGDLDDIIQHIKSYGEVTDDLSVMRVGFLENFENKQEHLGKLGIRVKEDGSVEDLNQTNDVTGFEVLEAKKGEAVRLFNQKQLDQAFNILKDLKNVFRRKRDHFDVAFMLGQCYIQRKEFDQALVSLKEALEVQPDHTLVKKLIRKIETQLK